MLDAQKEPNPKFSLAIWEKSDFLGSFQWEVVSKQTAANSMAVGSLSVRGGTRDFCFRSRKLFIEPINTDEGLATCGDGRWKAETTKFVLHGAENPLCVCSFVTDRQQIFLEAKKNKIC